ncbi:AAA family ATPase [Clostridium sp. M14]|uniref:AAA family ATPase n=1 Tax=Clostridium sp. M14 TaxID=2716311 RepID=UPI0013EED72B|nr:AAA family ATPase [Clostridium sp. M14]MBZ9693259.1 ATP-binding protein [Clostridium sp. M14]
MAKFVINKAKRENIYAKIALMAPSGGGKTYSSLRLATGMAEEIEAMTGKKAKIILLNTEGKRGRYYANEFNYDIIDLEPNFEPELFIDAIDYTLDEGYDIVIVDSSSAEWEGKGGCLEIQSKLGGKYQDWGKVTPRHEKFIQKIATSEVHMICTMRGKDQYVMTQEDSSKGGKSTKVEKVGVGAKQRDGFEYEFTATFMIDQKTNTAEPMKDNTHIFENDSAVKLTEEHGRKIIKWANEDLDDTPKFKSVEKKAEKVEATKEKEVVQKQPKESEKTLDELKSEIIAKCKELADNGKRQEVSVTIKGKNSDDPNPNSITSKKVAKEVLSALESL